MDSLLKPWEVFDFSAKEEDKEPRPILIVRLTTSHWHDGDGIHQKKSLRYLKRKSQGFNIMYEDSSMIGANEVFPRITNLEECKDGIYKVETCNEFGHWETPHIIEDYDYKLIKVEGK